MHKQIFVNLPCKNLPASKAFFEALGYQFNPQFTNELGASLIRELAHMAATPPQA